MNVSTSSSKKLSILVVRCDRLGDVILSTPVFEVIKRHYPHAHLVAMVQGSVASVLGGLPALDDILIYDPAGRHRGVRGFFRLISDIRLGNFRIAVVLQSQWKIAAAVFLANIRYRVGPLSRPHSFFFYNRGARQHRSQVEMHETDYNLELLRRLGIRVGTRNVPVSAFVSEDSRQKARLWLQSRGWNPEQPLICVHPGMGGSALNWPEAHYVEFIRALLREGRQILVTGGPTEVALLARISQALGPEQDRAIWYGFDRRNPGHQPGAMDQLAGLLSWVDLMVAPSTGPMHLAVALQKPVVTFFPPIRVQSAIRWGPYLRDESRASLLIPEVYCGEDFKCRGSLCNYHPCMKTLTVAQALEGAAVQLARVEQEKSQGKN